MPLQEKCQGTAAVKHNSWYRGNGANTMRGELKRGISLSRKQLNRKVRRQAEDNLKNSSYKKSAGQSIWWILLRNLNDSVLYCLSTKCRSESVANTMFCYYAQDSRYTGRESVL